MIINIEQNTGNLKVSYINETGDIDFIDINIPSHEQFNWVEATPKQRYDKTVKSWNGSPVTKKKTNYLSNYRVNEILNKQPEHIKQLLYTLNKPKIFFCDIETEVTEDGFPRPDLARNPVTVIGYCNGDNVTVLGTKKLTTQQIQNIEKRINEHFKDYYPINFNYIFFDSEYDMLISFMGDKIHKMPVVTGWNFVGFDWEYLVNRCERINIDPSISSVSGKLIGKNKIPQHRLIVDYLNIFKMWDKTIDIKENYSLDFISEAVLGSNKIKYNGTLQELYEQNFEDYVFYNAVDTLLVQHIHEKVQTIHILFSMANMTGVECRNAFSQIRMTESTMVREFQKRNRVFPHIYRDKVERESYEGAYVFDPTPGLYSAVASFDFASLHPSIMRQWNISLETYVKNTDKEIDDKRFIKTASGAVFRNDFDSVTKKIITDKYNMRQQIKHDMYEIDLEIEHLKKLL